MTCSIFKLRCFNQLSTRVNTSCFFFELQARPPATHSRYSPLCVSPSSPKKKPPPCASSLPSSLSLASSLLSLQLSVGLGRSQCMQFYNICILFSDHHHHRPLSLRLLVRWLGLLLCPYLESLLHTGFRILPTKSLGTSPRETPSSYRMCQLPALLRSLPHVFKQDHGH